MNVLNYISSKIIQVTINVHKEVGSRLGEYVLKEEISRIIHTHSESIWAYILDFIKENSVPLRAL